MGFFDRIKTFFSGRRTDLPARVNIKSLTPQDVMPRGWSGRPRFSEYSPDTAVQESFKKVVWVYACVEIIARNAASVPWLAYRRTDSGEEPDSDSDLQRLINKPNAEYSFNHLTRSIVMMLGLVGEGFVTKIRTSTEGASELHPDRGKPMELWAHLQGRFSPVPGGPNEPFIKHYEDKTYRDKKVDPEDMLHPLFIDPGNPYRGLPPLACISDDTDIEKEAKIWQMVSFQNRMVQDGLIKVREYLHEDQYEAMEKRIEEKWAGAKNARRPPLFGADVDWINIARNAVEMDFIESRKLTRENICAAYGVPPVLVGILDHATYSNYEQAELILWKHTILPLLGQLEDMYNMQLAPEFGADYVMRPDLTGVDALVQLFKERWDVAKEMVERGVPMSVANGRMGLGLPEYPGWDTPWIPSSWVPADTWSVDPMADVEE